jgi:hypothetical protein
VEKQVQILEGACRASGLSSAKSYMHSAPVQKQVQKLKFEKFF